MLGRSHVAVAAAAWALCAGPGADRLGLHLGPLELILSTAVAAGAGIGPDIDHPEATIARTHGPLSHAVALTVNKLTGGHRGATHWMVTAGALWAAVTWAAVTWPTLALPVALASCGAWALRCSLPYRIHRAAWAPLVAAAAGGAAWALGLTAPWLAVAAAFGWAIHPLCDAAASDHHKGPPLLGPFSRRRIGFGLMELGGTGEHFTAMGAAILAGLVVTWRLLELVPILGRLAP